MKKILKEIYKKYVEFKNQILWYIEFKKISRKIKYLKSVKKINIDENKMILIPHSDDEWIGCSQILKHRNTLLCNMNMNGNDSESLHKERYKELKNTAIKYDKKLITIKNDKVKKLKEIIEKFKPQMIFVPSFIDWHEEHQEVINILYKAIVDCRIECEIVLYQVSVPICEKFVNYAIPMSKNQIKHKWNYFINNYQTQKFFPYKRYMINERINGKMVNAFSSEIYLSLSKNEWINIKERINYDEIVKLRNNIQSISKTRKESEKLYEKYFIKKNRNNDIS